MDPPDRTRRPSSEGVGQEGGRSDLFTDDRKVSSFLSWIVVLFTDSSNDSPHQQTYGGFSRRYYHSTLAQMSTTNDRQCDASNVSVAGWDYYNALLDENSKIVF